MDERLRVNEVQALADVVMKSRINNQIGDVMSN